VWEALFFSTAISCKILSDLSAIFCLMSSLA